MQEAVKVGKPVNLDQVDIFCDGTAVRIAGNVTFPLCRDLVDEWVTVSNQEVSEAVHWLWNEHRSASEPAGAMGVAAAMKYADTLTDKKVLTVLCGANIDFSKLGSIARSTGSTDTKRLYLQIPISEKSGTMLNLLEKGLVGVDIVDFQYGKTDHEQAYPVFGIAASEDKIEAVKSTLQAEGYDFELIDEKDVVNFRIIPYEKSLISHPLFLNLDFYERPGALRDFLSAQIDGEANICYFNYNYTGERVGRALIGLEFQSESAKAQFAQKLPTEGTGYRTATL